MSYNPPPLGPINRDYPYTAGIDPNRYPPTPEIQGSNQISALSSNANIYSNPSNLSQTVQTANYGKTSVLGKISNWFKEHPKVILALKILAVAAVVAGLIAATIFTFGAALPAVAAITTASSMKATAGAFALMGVAVGLTFATVATPFIAKATHMYEVTDDNIKDTLTFFGCTLATTAISTGIFAASGAALGIKGLVAAKIGLSTIGTVALFGGGAGIAKAIIDNNSR